MHIILFTALFSMIITSCWSSNISKRTNNGQLIEYKNQFYDTVGNGFSKPFMIFREKVWYKDSIAIESVSTQNIVTNEKNETTEEVVVSHYRFTDLTKKAVYEYKTFSDTASIIRKYSLDDSVQISGGWNFKWPRRLDYNGAPQALPDTIINMIPYKRISLSTGTSSNPFEMICYFRCDKKGTVFSLDKLLSETVNCPMVKKYSFSLLKKGRASSTEVNFLSDSLTNDEVKVFYTWEKNMKKYPIK